MKIIKTVLLFLTMMGCTPNLDKPIIIKMYVNNFYYMQEYFTNHSNKKNDKTIYVLIDSIINNTKTGFFSDEIKKQIIAEIDKIPTRQFEDDKIRLGQLIDLIPSFEDGTNTFIEDLNFIDRFFEEKALEYLECNLSGHDIETLIALDTVLLYENIQYELPIRIEYNGFPSSVSIISNSIEGTKPSTINFTTTDASRKHQTIKYHSRAMNNITREMLTFKDSIIVKLVKNQE